MQKVTCLIDIKAPCQDVFNIVADLERRIQLSPLWGLSELLEVGSNYPEPGSSYRVRVLTDVPFGLSHGTLNPTQSAVSGLLHMLTLRLAQADRNHSKEPGFAVTKDNIETKIPKTQMELPAEQEYFISEYQPPHTFSYYLDEDCKTIVTWRFQSIPFGTRVNYEEVFCKENVGDENFIPAIRNVIREWLSNIKRYSELRDGRARLIIKWFLDRYYLKLRPDQRRVIQMLLFMQAIGLATFFVAVIGWGIVSIFF